MKQDLQKSCRVAHAEGDERRKQHLVSSAQASRFATEFVRADEAGADWLDFRLVLLFLLLLGCSCRLAPVPSGVARRHCEVVRSLESSVK